MAGLLFAPLMLLAAGANTEVPQVCSQLSQRSAISIRVDIEVLSDGMHGFLVIPVRCSHLAFTVDLPPKVEMSHGWKALVHATYSGHAGTIDKKITATLVGRVVKPRFLNKAGQFSIERINNVRVRKAVPVR